MDQPRTLPRLLIRHRGALSLLANALVLVVSYTLAFMLRFDLTIPVRERPTFLMTLPAAVLVGYGAFYVFKLTRGWWRYVGIGDFKNAVRAAASAGALLAGYVLFFHRKSEFPRSILLINAILVVGISMGVRLIVRLWREVPLDREIGRRKRLLVVGAGDTGDALLREVRQSEILNSLVVAFVDDNPSKRGAYINGVPVVDEIKAVADVVQRFAIDEIVVATPSASGQEMRAITEVCRAAAVPFKVLPATWEVLNGRVSLNAARAVEINDLLRRPPVALDLAGIDRFLKKKRVLVTGAAGSIGSEICRQVLRYQPSMLLCLDHDENALFYLERSLSSLATGIDIRYRLMDITDVTHVDALFEESKPQVVYHAAAHKHVPVIEANPVEGLRNNVLGTETVATLAGRHGAEAFVLISTDKAVNPSSVMGASKRISGQLLLRTLPWGTRYTSVRFGNVLGSQGSVVPLLQEQITRGGPVTITHPDMRRYFMTIPEAVELVIQASAMGKGDEIFMLDMGEPVKIIDLANDLIRLSGLTPGADIQIVFTGMRPGEKLAEELYLEAERAERTTHPKIMIARHSALDGRRFAELLEELRRAVDAHDLPAVRRLVPQLVPEYGRVPAGDGKVISLAAARARS